MFRAWVTCSTKHTAFLVDSIVVTTLQLFLGKVLGNAGKISPFPGYFIRHVNISSEPLVPDKWCFFELNITCFKDIPNYMIGSKGKYCLHCTVHPAPNWMPSTLLSAWRSVNNWHVHVQDDSSIMYAHHFVWYIYSNIKSHIYCLTLLYVIYNKKSRIQETPNLSTDANKSTNTEKKHTRIFLLRQGFF